jgi:hypothetical protein
MKIKPSETDVQTAIMDYLTAVHIKAIRYNTAAFKVGNRFFRAHSAGPGHSDVIAWIPTQPWPRTLFIEVKAPGKKQKPAQIEFQLWCEDGGMDYLVADSLDAVVDWIQEHK